MEKSQHINNVNLRKLIYTSMYGLENISALNWKSNQLFIHK